MNRTIITTCRERHSSARAPPSSALQVRKRKKVNRPRCYARACTRETALLACAYETLSFPGYAYTLSGQLRCRNVPSFNADPWVVLEVDLFAFRRTVLVRGSFCEFIGLNVAARCGKGRISSKQIPVIPSLRTVVSSLRMLHT